MPLALTNIRTNRIKSNRHNARTHSAKQLRQLANSIREFGNINPPLLDENLTLIAGHGRVEAARLLNLKEIPCFILKGLSEAKKRALMLADNRIALSAGWDREKLAAELLDLQELLPTEGLDIGLAGFEIAEIDSICADFQEQSDDSEDEVAIAVDRPAVSQAGDLWQLQKHRLLCGDSQSDDAFARLLEGERAAMAFTDPPYNVKIKQVVGRGARKHAEFAMASGEMSAAQFTSFLAKTLGLATRHSENGAVHFVCMDWRHLEQLLTAGREIYADVLNLIVWVKNNAGQGSFYRSQHEAARIIPNLPARL